ncbi:hypothetical protein CXB51_029295 [Gossypium anomalum]|uniref:RNase H type-1 domain-containing protein n=1 Tax=Gossypium anomalum TaxID=47600 RepID=A0A8J5YE30_9ROSI|nr:hypothetical protein CXB51_029295 [Gossypium anomalum]
MRREKNKKVDVEYEKEEEDMALTEDMEELHGTSKSLWLIALMVACWSVWFARNEMVFERKVLSMDTLIFHSKMRAFLWLRVAFDECMVQERLWWLSLSKCKSDSVNSKPITLSWCYPPHGWLKINVSGIAAEEATGCGGVLRDKQGVVRVLFSGPYAIVADAAELGAIITMLDVIIEIGWRGSCLIIVEVGSVVAYNWLLNEDRRPWSQQTTFADMERRLACVGEVAFSKAEQYGNEMAETLATTDSKPLNFDEVVKDEIWRLAMDEDTKSIEKTICWSYQYFQKAINSL